MDCIDLKEQIVNNSINSVFDENNNKIIEILSIIDNQSIDNIIIEDELKFNVEKNIQSVCIKIYFN